MKSQEGDKGKGGQEKAPWEPHSGGGKVRSLRGTGYHRIPIQ